PNNLPVGKVLDSPFQLCLVGGNYCPVMDDPRRYKSALLSKSAKMSGGAQFHSRIRAPSFLLLWEIFEIFLEKHGIFSFGNMTRGIYELFFLAGSGTHISDLPNPRKTGGM